MAFDEIILPVLRQFQPDLLLVSAGFDAHERDPLGDDAADDRGVRGDDDGRSGRVADECCRGRLALVTEGGYDLQALAASLDQTVQRAGRRRSPIAAVAGRDGRVERAAARAVDAASSRRSRRSGR